MKAKILEIEWKQKFWKLNIINVKQPIVTWLVVYEFDALSSVDIFPEILKTILYLSDK